MEPKKRNRREEYTFTVIRETFLEMLVTQSVDRISVGKLCEKADINRSTFYRHYTDIYALLDKICEDCFQNLFSDFAKYNNPSGEFENTAYELILRACTLTEENKELYQSLLFQHPEARFLQKLNDSIFQFYLDNHDKTHARTAETNLQYQYLISGILGIWQAWLRDGCTLPKSVVAEIVKVQISSVSKVILERHPPKRLPHGSFIVEG